MKTSKTIRAAVALAVLSCFTNFNLAQAVNITTLQNGVPVRNFSGATGSKSYFKVVVPPNQVRLVVATDGGDIGDCDLYVIRGSLPPVDESLHDNGPTNDEKVSIDYPEIGDWYEKGVSS